MFYSVLESFIELLLILDVTDRWTFSLRKNLQSVTRFFVKPLLLAKSSIMSLSAGITGNVKKFLDLWFEFPRSNFFEFSKLRSGRSKFQSSNTFVQPFAACKLFNQSSLCWGCRKTAQFHRVVTEILNWQSFLNTIIKSPYIEFFEFRQVTTVYTHLVFSFRSHNA